MYVLFDLLALAGAVSKSFSTAAFVIDTLGCKTVERDVSIVSVAPTSVSSSLGCETMGKDATEVSTASATDVAVFDSLGCETNEKDSTVADSVALSSSDMPVIICVYNEIKKVSYYITYKRYVYITHKLYNLYI